MGKWICGKCQSQSTYHQGGSLACMMCGNRTPSRWGFKSTDGAAEIKPLDPEIQGPLEEQEDDEREEMNMASKKGICMNCGKERSLPANDKCWKCNGYDYKGKNKAAKQKPAGVPAEMAPEKVKMIKTKLRHRLAEKIEKKEATSTPAKPERIWQDPRPIREPFGEPDHRVVILDFTLPENAGLYEPWVKYGRSHRRGPGDQAMMAVEQILTNEGLI